MKAHLGTPFIRHARLDLVEVWFGIIERQAIYRGSFGNVRELAAALSRGPRSPRLLTRQELRISHVMRRFESLILVK
jgi:hypothetical protein